MRRNEYGYPSIESRQGWYVEMIVVLVTEHDRVNGRKGRGIKYPWREYTILQGMHRPKLFRQERINEDTRAFGTKHPSLVTEKRRREAGHGRKLERLSKIPAQYKQQTKSG